MCVDRIVSKRVALPVCCARTCTHAVMHTISSTTARTYSFSKQHGTLGSIQSTPSHHMPEMTLCCIPRCFGCCAAVRWCPRCNASFAVCAMHLDHTLHCPWPAKFMIPCSALVPPDHSWSIPRPFEPMYVRPQDVAWAWYPEKKSIIGCVASSTQGHLTDPTPSPAKIEKGVEADQVDV